MWTKDVFEVKLSKIASLTLVSGELCSGVVRIIGNVSLSSRRMA